MIAEAIKRVVEGGSLSQEEMREVFGEVMEGKATDIQKSAFLVALRMKGETVDEIVGAARAMRERLLRVDVGDLEVIDTCGTGGDGRATFNVSTVAAFVAAGAGAHVAKHGNRAVSSVCGSADLLSALGVNIDLDAALMSEVLGRTGIAFLFAPKLHPATAAVVPIRRELGVRTIFNLLGPLTNPALARRQVMGVYSRLLVETVAEVLKELGSVHAIVVHSEDGMDEISVSAPTFVCELRDGRTRAYQLSPEELGVARSPISEIAGGDPALSAEIARAVLDGEQGARRDIVLINAGAALYVAALAPTIRDGVEMAAESIDSGRARAKLAQLVAVTNEMKEEGR